MNKAQIMVNLEGTRIKTGLNIEEVNPEGMCLLMCHLRYLLNRMEKKFADNLHTMEKEGK